MSWLIDTIVHIGAGRCGEVEEYRTTGAKRIILIEPDPEKASYLREEFGADTNTEVVERAVTPQEGPTVLKVFNVRRYSSLREPSGLRVLYPGLRKTGELSTDAWTPRQMCEELGIDKEAKNWLVVDAPGEEGLILESLREAGLLTRFPRISVYAAEMILYSGGRTARDILVLLYEMGWESVAENNQHDAEIPRRTLERDERKIENQELKRRAEQIEAKIIQKNTRIGLLEKQIDSQKEQLDSLERKNKEFVKEKLSQQKMHHELNAKLQKLENKSDKQMRRLIELGEERDSLKKAVAQSEVDAEKSKETRQELAQRLEKKEAEGREKSTEIERLKTRTDGSDEKIRRLEKEIHAQRVLMNAVEKERDELQTKNTSHEKQIRELDTSLQEQERVLNEREQRIQAILTEYEEWKRRQSQQHDEILKAEGQLDVIKDLLLREGGL